MSMEITEKHKYFKKSDLTPAEIYAIDTCLAEITTLNATLGVDSVQFEMDEVKIKIRLIEQKIKIISEEFYNQITN